VTRFSVGRYSQLTCSRDFEQTWLDSARFVVMVGATLPWERHSPV